MRPVFVAIYVIVCTNIVQALTIPPIVPSGLKHSTKLGSVPFSRTASAQSNQLKRKQQVHRYGQKKNFHFTPKSSSRKGRQYHQESTSTLHLVIDEAIEDVPFVSKGFKPGKQRKVQSETKNGGQFESRRLIKEHLQEDVDDTTTIKFMKDNNMQNTVSASSSGTVDHKRRLHSSSKNDKTQQKKKTFGWDHSEFMDRLSP